MANYKLPWNYEPGVNAAVMTRTLTTSGEYSQADYASIITDYNSKYSGEYCYYITNSEIVNVPYTIQVDVQRSNDPLENHYVPISEDEQLKVSYVDFNFYRVAYPAVQLNSFTYGWNAYTARPLQSYQLPKKTNGSTSTWVDASSMSNDDVYLYQRDKYFIPINTNINLNEEFRLRLWKFYTRINGTTYYLPDTYFVDNTTGNIAYSTYTSVLDVNPKIYDSSNNLVTGALTRVNGDWILNIDTIGTYTLYAYYSRQSKTLKPTGKDDFDPDMNHENLAWQVTLEAYNQDRSKVLSTDLLTYRQQGYNKLNWKAGTPNGWYVEANNPDEAHPPIYVSDTTMSAFNEIAQLDYLNNKSFLSEGLDVYQPRGINEGRKVELNGNFKVTGIYDSNREAEYALAIDENLAGTSTPIPGAVKVTWGDGSTFNLIADFSPANTNAVNEYITTARNLWLFRRERSYSNGSWGSWTTWQKIYDFQMNQSDLFIFIDISAGTTPYSAPEILLTTQLRYY